MSWQSFELHPWWRTLSFASLLVQSFSLNPDGILLLSLKFSIITDPLGVLSNWNSNDHSPCSWNGVSCAPQHMPNASSFRVFALSLPSSRLLGSIPANLGKIEHLRNLNLSNNSINGSIPLSLFEASELQVLDLSDNLISGELPELVGELLNLRVLNLSNNGLVGRIPENLTILRNLTVISLRNNYFSGGLPTELSSVEVLDLSSNLINGSLPSNFRGNNLYHFNASNNKLSGEIPVEFANQVPTNATIGLSFNNLSGKIPQTSLFINQEAKSYVGNPELCGNPLKNPCPILSTVSTPQLNATAPTSPPAIAAIPESTIDSTPETRKTNGSSRNGLRPGTIFALVVGDILGVAILGLVFLYVYQLKKKQRLVTNSKNMKTNEAKSSNWSSLSSEEEEDDDDDEEYRGIRALGCLRKQENDDEESSETENSDVRVKGGRGGGGKEGELVTVDDGEKKLELEALLKAAAYVVGATGWSILYKAVLEDGTALAVRRIGESCGVGRLREFENQVRVIAKLVHPNLVRIRGFYWGPDEKLVIYEFAPNGSLANARYNRKVGSPPCYLPWELRLKIARGVARGLTYIHEKKHVHGNLKPTNILFGVDMEPKIGDFGLERLVTGESGYKAGGSTRNFGSKRSTASRDSFQDATTGGSPSPSPSSLSCISPYCAPESLRSLKASPKWDVYSFGVVLLELLTGKVIVSDELGFGPNGLIGEEKKENSRILKMVDVTIRVDLEGKEDALLTLFKIGFNCISSIPQKRPAMKEVLQALEKFPSSSSSSLYY
ncbi:hypothetical protein U1Q18_039213 [Sarracenia purpurea var. burkii]